MTRPAMLSVFFGFAAVLSAAAALAAEPIELFNGKDLSGWDFDLAGQDAKMEDVWSVEDGVLKCAGKPAGYIVTKKKDYGDYKLELDWRWSSGKGGNNGVLVHCSTPRELGIWCKSVEVQLQAGHAGDFWVIGTELDVEKEQTRKQGRRHINLTDDSEKPLGEWNHMEIVCAGDTITVYVNGDMVNKATNVNVTSGGIALQSEGTPIEYRNIKLTPLE